MRLDSVTVPLVNKPGSMASVLEVLAAAEVPIKAYSTDRDSLHLMTDEGHRAIQTLQELGFPCDRHPLEEIRVADRPGELARLFRLLADANINVIASFGIGNGASGRLYVHLDQPDRAGPILRRFASNAITPPGLTRIA